MNLFFAMLIGVAVGLFTSLRRYGGLVTFIASTASFAVALRSFHILWIGFVASGGGIGILLVIIGIYISTALWAHSLALDERSAERFQRCINVLSDNDYFKLSAFAPAAGSASTYSPMI